MWASLVDALQAVVFGLGHFAGNSLGTGIFLAAFLLRVALLPISIRLARRARRQQERLALLQPRLRQLQARWKTDPIRLHKESLALFREHGYRPVDGRSLLGNLIQIPPLSAMFAVIRRGIGAGIGFGWVADLARPDLPLAILVGLLAAGGALLGSPASAGRNTMVTGAILTGGMTLAFLWFSSSAMALSVAASGVIGIGQNWWIRRTHRQARPR